MDNKPTKAGKSAATPAPEPISADEKLAKALRDIEEMNKQLKAREEAQIAREKALDEREQSLKNTNTEAMLKVIETHKSKAQKMKEALMAQPKVMIMIPPEAGEPEGATLPVTLNGFRMNIRKNTYVEVPRQVADLIRDILGQNEAAGRDFRIDVPRASKGGITFEQALLD